MIDQTDSGHDSRVRSLEAEILSMRRQVELRDELLRVLNRRLLQLERGEIVPVPMSQIEPQSPRDDGPYLRRLVRSMLDTDLFRWALPARRFRGRIYARRQGSP